MEAFEPTSATERWPVETRALELAIEETLAKTFGEGTPAFVPPEADIAGGPVSCAVAYKSPQSPTSSILRQSAFCMKTGADEFVLATNARRTHELTVLRIDAKECQDRPGR